MGITNVLAAQRFPVDYEGCVIFGDVTVNKFKKIFGNGVKVAELYDHPDKVRPFGYDIKEILEPNFY